MLTKEELIEAIHDYITTEETYQDDYITSRDYASNYFTDKPDYISDSDKIDRITKLLSYHPVPDSVIKLIDSLNLEVKLFDHLYSEVTPSYQGSIHASDTVIESSPIGEQEIDFGRFSSLQPDEMDDATWQEIVNEACESYSGNVYLKKQSGYWYGYITYDYEMIAIDVSSKDLDSAIEDIFNKHSSLIEAHYTQQLTEDYDWDKVASECKSNLSWDRDSQYFQGLCFLGTLFTITPSGKVYAPWTSNQTNLDETLDSIWNDALDSVLDSHGFYRWDHEESIFAAVNYDATDLPLDNPADPVCVGFGFATTEDYNKWLTLAQEE